MQNLRQNRLSEAPQGSVEDKLRNAALHRIVERERERTSGQQDDTVSTKMNSKPERRQALRNAHFSTAISCSQRKIRMIHQYPWHTLTYLERKSGATISPFRTQEKQTKRNYGGKIKA